MEFIGSFTRLSKKYFKKRITLIQRGEKTGQCYRKPLFFENIIKVIGRLFTK